MGSDKLNYFYNYKEQLGQSSEINNNVEANSYDAKLSVFQDTSSLHEQL